MWLEHPQAAPAAALYDPRRPLLRTGADSSDLQPISDAVSWSAAAAYTRQAQQAQAHAHTRAHLDQSPVCAPTFAPLSPPTAYRTPVSTPSYFAPLSSPAANHNLHLRRLSASTGTSSCLALPRRSPLRHAYQNVHALHRHVLLSVTLSLLPLACLRRD